MPKYRIPEKSFIGERMVEAGTVIQYDGIPGSKWEVVEDSPVIIPDNDVAEDVVKSSVDTQTEMPTVKRGRKSK